MLPSDRWWYERREIFTSKGNWGIFRCGSGGAIGTGLSRIIQGNRYRRRLLSSLLDSCAMNTDQV